MRLIKIGRSTSNNIVLNSEKVSSIHAEIIVLENGDILLEDKNSQNGTYLMNKQIKPGTPVSIRRGDAVRFADIELQWNQIPTPEDNSKYNGVFGIGSNFRNEIQIEGSTASRFHATLKIGKDGKAYIQDHSKNGTTVNGMKIRPNENVRIKRNDAIVCGGIPVDVKRFIKPNLLPKILTTIGIAAVIVGAVFFVKAKGIPGINNNPSIEALESATACVQGDFYVVVTLEDDPFIEVLKEYGWPTEWIFGYNEQNKSFPALRTMTTNADNIGPITYSGTAFFITNKGELGTNRHIAAPWLYLNSFSEGSENKIKQTMAEVRNVLLPINELKTNKEALELTKTGLGQIILKHLISSNGKSLGEINGWISRFKSSGIKISGKIIKMGVGLKGENFTSTSELLPCYVVAESGDKDIDVALLRLNKHKTPDDIIKKGFFDINKARLDETKLKPQEEELITMGYPHGFILGLLTENQTLKPTVHKISVSKDPDDKKFQFQGEEVSGASGSPIVDSKDHRLVGVLFGGYNAGSTFGAACNIKHLYELYQKNKAKDE